ncbi:unnamed protein product [Adineta ricciae]|uniref:Uncharacterized protein n=1 Tax=Adineta ricciae TaxID=249248 RepID=A0A813PLE7_ADIRI|nr:unnamed protein product [Adineta ricciae]
MTNRSNITLNCDMSPPKNTHDRQLSSQDSSDSNVNHASHFISQRQLSDSRVPTNCVMLFENAFPTTINDIVFVEYCGTRARNHHKHRLYIPQLLDSHPSSASSNDAPESFSDSIRKVLSSISDEDLSSYVISIRTGVFYFFSKHFRFNGEYSIDVLRDLLEKKILSSDRNYYYEQTNTNYHSDETLRSAFCNVKPISHSKDFAEKLYNHKFYLGEQKHLFRIYLKSNENQTHVCVVDPASSYSIVEFSKDFQRTSNIDYIRDRQNSKYRRQKTFDDVFDFRIQFQYHSRTGRDHMSTIEDELRNEFPSLDVNFQNKNILRPIDNQNDETYHVSEQLCPYVQFIRRDFGDVYHYNGTDPLFENFTIYLESPVEYRIDYATHTCKRELETHGIVYARLNLDSLMTSNGVDEQLLIRKLWDMGTGLTSIAGECTTLKTQQSTNYYTMNGDKYTAEEERLVQRILKRSTLPAMLGLSNHADSHAIDQVYKRIMTQLESKWQCFQHGSTAHEKLACAYELYQSQHS